jgi:hypothetical protein
MGQTVLEIIEKPAAAAMTTAVAATASTDKRFAQGRHQQS